MRKNLLVLLLCASSAIAGHARDVRIAADSIPACTGSFLYDSENFRISQYEFGEPMSFVSHLGYFNWGPSSGNFAIVNNPIEDNRPTLVAFDTLNFLVYGRPDTVDGWFPAVRTDVQFGPGYKTVAAYDDRVYLLQGPALYTYRIGGDLDLLRNDLDPRISQQVVDEDFNFIFVSDPPGGATWDGDAVVVVDTTGYIRYRFAFDPPLNCYNVTSLFMVNDSLFFISGSLNQTFGRSLVHIALDYDTYTATPVRIASAGDFTHLFSCSPGRLVAGCAPNVEIGPGTTQTTETAESRIRCYPNPVIDDIHVDGEVIGPAAFEVYGPDSKCVKRGSLDALPARIWVADLVPGLYVLRIVGVGTTRFVKM